MHRVLPGCTYGCIPKVQGALDGPVVGPVPAVLEPRVHCIAPARYGCMRRAHGEAKRTQGRHVSSSVFSVRHTWHGSHEENALPNRQAYSQCNHSTARRRVITEVRRAPAAGATFLHTRKPRTPKELPDGDHRFPGP